MTTDTEYHKLPHADRVLLINLLMTNDKFDLAEMYLEKCTKAELEELVKERREAEADEDEYEDED